MDPSTSSSTSNRRNMGRSARRRRKKLLEIQKAEEQLLNNQSTTSSSPAIREVIPSDRGRVWPGVEERLSLSEAQDAVRITSQLGYLPGNAIRVSARASNVPLLLSLGVDPEEPVVLQLYPIAVRDEHTGGTGHRKKKQRKRRRMVTNTTVKDDQIEEEVETEDATKDGQESTPPADSQPADKAKEEEEDFVVEPFPTLYWLTHPLLRTLVSKMELQSMGVQLEKRLKQEADSMASMERAHAAYGQERYDLLTKNDIGYIEERKWQGAFDPKRGVAGIRNFGAVKCLHAHAAHYLSQGKGSADNVLGKWVMEEIERTWSKKTEQAFDK